MVDYTRGDDPVYDAFRANWIKSVEGRYRIEQLDEELEWISVEEQLPEPLHIYSPPDIKHTYLVACYENSDPSKYFYGYTFAQYMSDGKGGAKWSGDHGEVGLGVVYWMPLPKPPIRKEST